MKKFPHNNIDEQQITKSPNKQTIMIVMKQMEGVTIKYQVKIDRFHFKNLNSNALNERKLLY